MIRHIAMFTWTAEATDEQKAAVATALDELPGLIPQIRSFAAAPDAGISQGNYDFAVVADFDSADDFLVYRDDPRHQAVIAERIKPILASRAAAQLSL
ncbi:Dabb family protein [Nonomuraea terrae]|uniref:Dabb family protein n=1 Tax=Nonomuraea terrae TaxID=2530383 RepID=A0A4R4ZJM3_9ACTN|nr:Dabb family protein [Nonomuraea terrae]TDD56912.1 Dabb family protein [Nonomuraea terrae]